MATTTKAPSIAGGARRGAGRKTDLERSTQGYIDYNEARARREHFNAQIAEMEAQQMAGTLVKASEVGDRVQRLHVNFRAKMLSIPTKLAPSLVGVESIAEVEAALEAAIHEALSELAGGRA